MNSYLLVKPIITEKSLMLAQTRGQFTFEVDRLATKSEVKAIVESVYNVTVKSVNSTTRWGGLKKTGKKRVVKVMPKVKKVMVQLAKGQTLDVFDIQGGADQA